MKVEIGVSLALASLMGVEAFSEPFYTNPKPYSQDMLDNYNLLKYTTWMGPWSQRRGVGLNRDTPLGCKVDQVAMLHRHGERYPDKYAVVDMNEALDKLTPHKGKLKGDLEFLNYWVPFITPDGGLVAQESTVGAYSGLLDAYNRGTMYRARYGHLWDQESIVPIFTSGYERIVQTGRHFGEGFFGFNYTDSAAINIIPEVASQGADSLVPVCHIPNNATVCDVPESARAKSPDNPPWKYEEFGRAAARFNRANKGLSLNVTADDIPQLMSFAAFELNVRGSSPWAKAFTSEEWIAFEYLQSSYYNCYYGNFATNTPARGSLYLNATRVLLNQGPENSLPMAWSFAHDINITPVVALLGFATDKHYDPTKVTFGNKWDVTDITPQGAHIVFERLVCSGDEDDEYALLAEEFPASFNVSDTNATYASNATYPGVNSSIHTGVKENIYVRVVLNEAVAPLPGCDSGPGKSCKLSDFSKLVDKAIAGVDFVKTCNVSADAPQYLSFFWDYNTTNSLNYDTNPIPYQAGLLNAEGNPIQES
ncbi:3-phytase B [Wickerhamiella sorbophila]|uniref:3-phytase B n=1 Tax=Wickerhamiella sorbophila TaxID=45607 RepID=A0A2T0FHQ6_9ASCO|nr:3-phytase B [Wickerhamiella sorbophila]PRT54532.1 3-phytase B [Wickerhamiella sorbophila]